MRNGVLIEETSPQDILFKENTNSLEEAFLSISRNQNFVRVKNTKLILPICF